MSRLRQAEPATIVAGYPLTYTARQHNRSSEGIRTMGAGAKTIISSIAAIAIATSAQAAGTEEFNNVESLVIEDFIGSVEIKTHRKGGARVVMTDGEDASYPVRMNSDDGVLTIKSDEDPDKTRWWDDVDWRRHDDKAFVRFLETYPTLVISVAQGTDVSFDSTVTQLKAGDIGGDLALEKGHVEGEVGNVQSADINIHGSADLKVGAVTDALEISIHGSGDVISGSASLLNVSIHGSGDVRVGDVDGAAAVQINGSGDVNIGKVGGATNLNVHGSGDISTGAVKSGADISVHGSGDISLASVAGKTSVAIHGSGDTEINGGRSEDLVVRVRGSGDFRHAGLATNPNVSVNGSGDVTISKYEGSIRTSGDGDIRIAGRYYGDED